MILPFTLFLLGVLTLNSVMIGYNYYDQVYALVSPDAPPTIQSLYRQEPVLSNPDLKAELVFKGIKFPSSMAFLGPNDILLLQKDNGTVDRIVNGRMLPHPLLHVNVATEAERGLLGIAVSRIKSTNSTRPTTTYVFLYYTESGGGKTGDDTTAGVKPLGNRLYRYELINDKLVNPKLLLNLPASPGIAHNGGKIVIGPDNNVYVVIGDVNDDNYSNATTLAENVKGGRPADGRGGILRITQEGQRVGKGILGDGFPLNLYYSYGIRNSFGMDFDPLTKTLWATENGPRFGDQIELVEPGHNSGWMQVQGIWKPHGVKAGDIMLHPESNLVDFGGKGKYRPPEFTWYGPDVGPTGLKFLNSDKLGRQYKDDMFVGDFHFGNLYHFKLNAQRNGLLLSGPLATKVAANSTEPAIQSILFGHGFGGITDVQVGPDGYLYVLSLYAGGDNCDPVHPRPCIQYSSSLPGTIFRIAPSNIQSELK